MKEDLFHDLVTSIEEAGEIRRGERPPSRGFTYEGHVLVAIQEKGKTVWSIERAAQQIEPALLARLDVQAIRESLNQTQEGFAELLGISTGTLQGWEQGRRKPRGAAETLLQVAACHPRAVLNTVKRTRTKPGGKKSSETSTA